MKTAYTGWMWVNQYVENSEEFRNQFIQCVKELSYLGYDYLENFPFLKRHFTSSEVKKNMQSVWSFHVCFVLQFKRRTGRTQRGC